MDIFVSSGVAQLCQKGHRRRQCAKHDVPRLKIHRRGASNSIWPGWPGTHRLVGHWWLPFSVERSEKVCAHLANPCYCNKKLEDMIAHKSCPLQWDPSPVFDQPQNGLTMRVWKLVGALVGALAGGRFALLFCLVGSDERVDQTEPQNNNQPTIQRNTDLTVESRKTFCEQHTCLQCKYQGLELYLHGVASLVFFHVKPTTDTNTCFQSCWMEPNRSGKIGNIMCGCGNHFRIAML